MILKKAEALTRVECFEDSEELAQRLRWIAETLDGPDAYYLNECATHIEGLFELARSLACHIKSEAA